MPAVAVEEVHERARHEQYEGQIVEDVRPVLGDEVIGTYRGACPPDPADIHGSTVPARRGPGLTGVNSTRGLRDTAPLIFLNFTAMLVDNLAAMGLCRRLMILVLSATLAAGIPVFMAYAAGAGEPCPMMADDAGTMPDCDTPASHEASCAQYCATACAGVVLSSAKPCSAASRSERVLALPFASFDSRAGPPGLQPPR